MKLPDEDFFFSYILYLEGWDGTRNPGVSVRLSSNSMLKLWLFPVVSEMWTSCNSIASTPAFFWGNENKKTQNEAKFNAAWNKMTVWELLFSPVISWQHKMRSPGHVFRLGSSGTCGLAGGEKYIQEMNYPTPPLHLPFALKIGKMDDRTGSSVSRGGIRELKTWTRQEEETQQQKMFMKWEKKVLRKKSWRGKV